MREYAQWRAGRRWRPVLEWDLFPGALMVPLGLVLLHIPLWLALMTFGLIAMMGVGMISFSQRKLLATATQLLRDDPPAVDQFPVYVTFTRKSLPYGHDVGVLSFVDNVLHFQGTRCTFSLTPKQGRRVAPFKVMFDGPDGHERGLTFVAWENVHELQVQLADWGVKVGSVEPGALPPVVSDGGTAFDSMFPQLGFLTAGTVLALCFSGTWIVLPVAAFFYVKIGSRLIEATMNIRALRALP